MYTIGLNKVKYLGHTFSAKGTKPDPQKESAVSDWEIPNNFGELRSFLRLAHIIGIILVSLQMWQPH